MRSAGRTIALVAGAAASVAGLTSLVLIAPRLFLPGSTSVGHHQIEEDCRACHEPFGGAPDDRCVGCHGDELEQANDSHRRAKFADPRTFAMLATIDATHCVACHNEHVPESTRKMGVTVPIDFCIACHADIASERPSHKGLRADGCARASCHNYHDNRALYEDFIAQHLREPAVRANAVVPVRNFAAIYAAAQPTPPQPLSEAEQNGVLGGATDAKLIAEWAASSHARAGVNCFDCHGKASGSPSATWNDHPGIAACAACHAREPEGFLAGRHGMRIGRSLSAMTPGQARIPMKADASERPLTCNSCHPAHRFDTRRAASEACLGCHNDAHSKAYTGTPHQLLWKDELAGRKPANTGVSCATCHMPRLLQKERGQTRVVVQHNQSDNLRPRSKMVRSVCLICHGLGFTLDALADRALVTANFTHPAKKSVPTMEMVARRVKNR